MSSTLSKLKLFSLSSLLLLNGSCEPDRNKKNTSPYDPAYEVLYPMLVELHNVRLQGGHFLGFDNTAKQEFATFQKFRDTLPKSVQQDNTIVIDKFWNKIYVKKKNGTQFQYSYAHLDGPQKSTAAGLILSQ